jgi:hypothetical protein
MATNALAPQEPGVLNRLYKQLIPVNARMLIDTARGDTSPITETNFAPDELAVLRNIYDAKRNVNKNWKQDIANELSISEAEYNKNPKMQLVSTGKPGAYVRGPLPYADYIQDTVNRLDTFNKTSDKTSIGYADYPGGTGAPTFDSWIDAIKKSYTDPAYRMKTTLGRFNVNEAPEGARATDQYNFDAKSHYESAKKINLDTANAYDLWKKSSGPVDFLDMMMIKYAPDKSRQVDIKLPEASQ